MPQGKNTIADPSLLMAASDPQFTTVARLPATGNTFGDRHFVTDASATTFASTVAGGGANKVPVYWDGAWKIG